MAIQDFAVYQAIPDSVPCPDTLASVDLVDIPVSAD